MNARSLVRVGLLATILVGNCFLVPESQSVTTANDVRIAGIGILPKFKTGKKTYDSLGHWNGCIEGTPKQCIMMTIPLTRIYMSDEGVILD